MTDEPKGGTPQPDEGNAQDAPRTPAVDGADAGTVESAEDRAKRLEQELLNQKKLIAGLQAKAERLNELERSGAHNGAASTSPMPTPGADPDQAMLEQLVEEYRQYPTAAGAYAIRDAQARLMQRQQQAAFEAFVRRGEADLAAADADDDTRALARELLKSGKFADAEAALWAARGQRGDKRAAAEAERAKRDEAARVRTSSVASTATGGDAAPAPTLRKMTQREFTLFLERNEGTPAARQLVADLDSGKLVLDTSVT